MVCDICGKAGVRQRFVSRSYGKGAPLLVIEGVPVMSCPHCGESYLTAHTLHEVERIKREREGIAIRGGFIPDFPINLAVSMRVDRLFVGAFS